MASDYHGGVTRMTLVVSVRVSLSLVPRWAVRPHPASGYSIARTILACCMIGRGGTFSYATVTAGRTEACADFPIVRHAVFVKSVLHLVNLGHTTRHVIISKTEQPENSDPLTYNGNPPLSEMCFTPKAVMPADLAPQTDSGSEKEPATDVSGVWVAFGRRLH